MGSKSLKSRAMCMADGGTVQKESPEQLMARIAGKYKIASADTPQAPQPAPQAEQSPAQRAAGQGIVALLKGRGQQVDRAAGYAVGGTLPNYGDDSKSGLNARLAAMQASNGGADGSATAQFNTPEQNTAMNSLMGQTQPVAQGLTTQPAVSQQAPTTFQQDLDARQERMTSLSGRLKSMENAARSGADISSPFGTNVPKNFASGGIVARAFQFKGKGGPTDDEIPVKVAGQNINVSNGEKAVVLPAKTAQNPQAVSAIEDIIEQSNGKPTNRQGNNFAAGGLTFLDDFKSEDTKKAELAKIGEDAANKVDQATYAAQEAAKPAQAKPSVSAPQVSAPVQPTADSKPTNPVLAEQQPAVGGLSVSKMPAGSKAPNVYDEMGNKTAGGDISGQKLYTNVGGTQGMSAMDAPLANVPGSSPIPTVPGLSLSQRAGNPNLGTAADNVRQLENIQKANSMMTPQGGASFIADQNEAANAEKTARWRQDELIGALKQSGNRHGKSALGQALAAEINGQNGLAAETLRQQTARDAQSLNANNAAVTQGLTRRAQDQAAARDTERNRVDELRLAGNPLDNQERQLEINRKARINALQEQAINGKTDEEKQSAIKALNSLSGRQEAKYKALTAGGGKNAMGEVMPERVVVVDENTGRFINEGAPQAGDMLAEAKAAIAKGADRAAVNARLKQAGIKETL